LGFLAFLLSHLGLLNFIEWQRWYHVAIIFIHSFIMSISIAPLQGDYSGALPIPVWPKGKPFMIMLCKWVDF